MPSIKPSSPYGNRRGYCNAMYDGCNSLILCNPHSFNSTIISWYALSTPILPTMIVAISEHIGRWYSIPCVVHEPIRCNVKQWISCSMK